MRGIVDEGNLNKEYPGSLAISSMHMFHKLVLRLKTTRTKLLEMRGGNASYPWITEGSWYGICAKSLFQPSDYVMSYLRPYLKYFQNGPVLGIQVRSGGKTSDWKDGSYFKVNKEVVRKNGPRIHQILIKRPNMRIFLSTDSDEIEDYIRFKYGRKVITVNTLPRNHVGRFPSEAALLRTYMDLYLLGQCKYLFLTKRSGFSRTGLAMNANNPEVYYFNLCLCFNKTNQRDPILTIRSFYKLVPSHATYTCFFSSSE